MASKSSPKALKEKKRQQRQRERFWWGAIWGVAGLAVIVVISFFVWDALRPKPGQSVAVQSRTHIQVGDAHEPYNSDPPTSGAHAGPAEAGFYSQALPDENLVHNLEHGYVVISYNCGTLPESDCQSLQDNVRSLVENNGEKLIGVARPTLDTPVALTAWGRMLKLEDFDEVQILEFIKDFRYKGPEGNAP